MAESNEINIQDRGTPFTGSVLITHEVGLHARPSVTLTKLAKQFDCEIGIGLSEKGPWVNAKSISKVMKMKAPQNEVLYLTAEGKDADLAIREIIKLVENDFSM